MLVAKNTRKSRIFVGLPFFQRGAGRFLVLLFRLGGVTAAFADLGTTFSVYQMLVSPENFLDTLRLFRILFLNQLKSAFIIGNHLVIKLLLNFTHRWQRLRLTFGVA